MKGHAGVSTEVKLAVRGGRQLPCQGIGRLLIRGTNWIGDVVMTLPALAAIRKTWPGARISVLAKPWVAEVYRLCPAVDEVIVFQEPGRHAGIAGRLRLARELRGRGFDGAILLQNAIEAAIIAVLARIPLRAGYNSDGRGVLLTHSVRRTAAIRRVHQIDYYVEMVRALGCTPAGREAVLSPGPDDGDLVRALAGPFGIDLARPLIGIAPGAAYGPAKMWFPDRFAAVADRLIAATSGQALLFGSGSDRESTARVQSHSGHSLVDLAGQTDLKEAMALISRCRLFISNDSGLMHVAGALGVPTVAIFGSTNPEATSPPGKRSVVVHHAVPCGPCLKPVCPTDFRCMESIGVEEVTRAALDLLEGGQRGAPGE
jgi:heptosyltransferase-2